MGLRAGALNMRRGDHRKHRRVSVLGEKERTVLGRFGQFSSQCAGISFPSASSQVGDSVPVCSQLSAAEPSFTPGVTQHRQRWGPLFLG